MPTIARAGFEALESNTTGGYNTADGQNALYHNTTGGNNTSAGYQALENNTSGSNNVAVGYEAGENIATGSNNIEIGSPGAKADSNYIRIGTQGTQKATYIAGIAGSSVTGDAVNVSSTGQLGIVMSSARYKRDIHDMNDASSNLMKLRPVTFRYKDDPAGTLQYGLVAEEVEKLYPELVTHATDGEVQSVRYSMLTGMLLNELQKQAGENQQQAKRIKALAILMAAQAATDQRRSVSTDRQIAELKATHARDLREIRSEFAQRLATIERTLALQSNAKMAKAFEQ